ncbi:hypothetical protein TNCT_131561 [Trichonephila clavata]|uniref:Uncharacterized protein n=1 Tax=Trichonephila clavata TaxID=2740835 RepID=A0A8X6JY38_TRICU|nr:hypothetical protein TNCT_131561 [Trichonephila clavata]
MLWASPNLLLIFQLRIPGYGRKNNGRGVEKRIKSFGGEEKRSGKICIIRDPYNLSSFLLCCHKSDKSVAICKYFTNFSSSESESTCAGIEMRWI